jgi:hypothetical protein
MRRGVSPVGLAPGYSQPRKHYKTNLSFMTQ